MLRASRSYETLKRIGLTLFFSITILITTMVATEFGKIANASTVAFCFLILVLLSAFFGDLTIAIATSIVATMCFNYFFLPPIGTWRIDAFDDWISLTAFLLTAIAISRLTASASEHTQQRRLLEKTDSQLKEFALWLLSMPREHITLQKVAEEAVRIFSLQHCSIHLHDQEKWKHFSGTGSNPLSKSVEENLELSVARPVAIELLNEESLGVRYTQIRKGMEPFLVLVVKSADLPASAMNILASMVGLLVPDILGEPNRTPEAKDR